MEKHIHDWVVVSYTGGVIKEKCEICGLAEDRVPDITFVTGPLVWYKTKWAFLAYSLLGAAFIYSLSLL